MNAKWPISLLVLMLALACSGQSTNKEKHLINERPVIIPDDKAVEKPPGAERGNRKDRTRPEGSVGDMVREFQKAREAYLARQQALLRQMKEATAEERAILRQRFQEAIQEWKEMQKQMLREQRDRAQEIKNELQPDLGRVVDEARREGRGR